MIAATVYLLFIVAYSVVGSVALRSWYRRMERRRPANVSAHSNAWLRPLLLRLLFLIEGYALLAGLLGMVWLLVITLVTHSKAASNFIVGAAGGLVGIGAVFAMLDVLAITVSRRAARKEQSSAPANPDDASPFA